MRKFLTCLCIFTICLGVFTGCAENRVPQPDEGTTEFTDLETLNLGELDWKVTKEFTYEDVKNVIAEAMKKAKISDEFVPYGAIKHMNINNCIYGTVKEKPIAFWLSGDLSKVYNITSVYPRGHHYYANSPERFHPPIVAPDGTRGLFDFYSGKLLTLEEYLNKFPEQRK